MDTPTKKPWVSWDFQSWGALLDVAVNGKSEIGDDHRSSRICRRTWHGVKKFEEAVVLAREGWLSAAQDTHAIVAPIFDKVSSLIERTDVLYDVEGHGIDIGRFVQGEPECWQRFETVTVDGPGHKIIRIVFNQVAHCEVGHNVIKTRGVAALALITLLEYAGHRVELIVNSGAWKFGKHSEAPIIVKRADDALDEGRLAYALCHPSMLRCLYFSVWETSKEAHALGAYHGGGYGRPCHVLDRGDIYFSADQRAWDTPEAMQGWLMGELERQGIKLNKDAARAHA